jgi:hypothetical protein
MQTVLKAGFQRRIEESNSRRQPRRAWRGAPRGSFTSAGAEQHRGLSLRGRGQRSFHGGLMLQMHNEFSALRKNILFASRRRSRALMPLVTHAGLALQLALAAIDLPAHSGEIQPADAQHRPSSR